MTDRSDLVDKVAEALKQADISGDPPSDEHYQDLAQAAIDAYVAWQHLQEALRREDSEVEVVDD